MQEKSRTFVAFNLITQWHSRAGHRDPSQDHGKLFFLTRVTLIPYVNQSVAGYLQLAVEDKAR